MVDEVRLHRAGTHVCIYIHILFCEQNIYPYLFPRKGYVYLNLFHRKVKCFNEKDETNYVL